MAKDVQKSYTASQLMKRQIRQLALLLALLLTVVAILVWSTNRQINRGVEEVISVSLEENLAKTTELIFGEDPYLVPDTAYLIKLKDCFYEGQVTGSDGEIVKLQEDILINIRKGVQYNASTLRSAYLMLADESAPFVIRNGYIVTKSGLLDGFLRPYAPGYLGGVAEHAPILPAQCGGYQRVPAGDLHPLGYG